MRGGGFANVGEWTGGVKRTATGDAYWSRTANTTSTVATRIPPA